MTLLLFFNYMAMVDLANNSSNNFSIKLAVAKNSIPKGSEMCIRDSSNGV